MNKYFLFFSAVLFSLGIVSCKKEKPDYSKGFVKYFGGIKVESASDVRQTSDGGYIIVGTTSSFGKGGSDMYAVKTDANGNVQWNKTYGDTLNDAGASVAITSDGGFVLLGTFRYIEPGLDSNKTDILLVKTNSSGDVAWSKKFGLSGTNEVGVAIAPISNGGFIIAGNTDSKGDGDMIFFDVNANGERPQPSKPYISYPSVEPVDATGLDKAINVLVTPSGDYIFSSYTYALNSPRVAILTSNLQGSYAASTSNEFEETSMIGGYAGEVAVTNDGNYVLTGKTNNLDVFVLKFRGTGSSPKIWYKTFGGPGSDEGSSIQTTPDGGYIVLGSTYSFGAGSKDMYLLKLNSSGDVEWTQTFGGAGSDEGKVVRLTSDGGYVILGTLEFGDDPSDGDNIITLVKVDSKGEIKN